MTRGAIVTALLLAACTGQEHLVELRVVGDVEGTHELYVFDGGSCAGRLEAVRLQMSGGFEARVPLIGSGSEADPARLAMGEQLPLVSETPTLVAIVRDPSCQVVGLGCWNEGLRPDLEVVRIDVVGEEGPYFCPSGTGCRDGRCDEGVTARDAGRLDDAGAPADAGPPLAACASVGDCAAGEDCCTGSCVSTLAREHCGSCDVRCTGDHVCLAATCGRQGPASVRVQTPEPRTAGASWELRLVWARLDYAVDATDEIGGRVTAVTPGMSYELPITTPPSVGTSLCQRAAACSAGSDPFSDDCVCLPTGAPQLGLAFVTLAQAAPLSEEVGYADEIVVFSDRATDGSAIAAAYPSLAGAFGDAEAVPAGFSVWVGPPPMTPAAAEAPIDATCLSTDRACAPPAPIGPRP